MSVVQAKAFDNGAGSTALGSSFPGTCVSGNYRFGVSCPRPSNGTVINSEQESPGAVNWSKQTTNIDDPDFIGGNAIQVWAPASFNATTSRTVTLASSVAGIDFFIEDDEIDTTVGFLGGILKDNSVAANPQVTGAKSFTGDVVVYEVTTSGGGSNVGWTAGSGRTALSGTNITTGHHGNASDGDDMFIQRRVVLGGGSLSASIGNSGLASANTAMFVFRLKATATNDDDQVTET